MLQQSNIPKDEPVFRRHRRILHPIMQIILPANSDLATIVLGFEPKYRSQDVPYSSALRKNCLMLEEHLNF